MLFLYRDVEDVVSADQDAAIVGDWLVASAFSGPFKDYVHMAITSLHVALVGDAVFQGDCDIVVQLLH